MDSVNLAELTKSCLVLARREGEAVHIGDEVIVEVVRVGQIVRLAIRAPRHITIRRAELIGKPKIAPNASSPPA